MKTTKLENKKIEIKFRFDYGSPEFSKTVNLLKAELNGRVWNPEKKCWIADLNEENIKALSSWGFDIDPLLQIWLKDAETPLTKKKKKIEIKGLKKPLFNYQQEGVEFIEALQGRALIGDEMGLGKTIQAIAYLELHPELRPAIVICPASVKYNWEKEINNWITSNSDTKVMQGRNGGSISSDIIIINYDIVAGRLKELKELKPKCIILDEVHMTKNSKAQRTKAIIDLCKGVKHILALSGTPIISRPIEFYNILKILDPSMFPSKTRFGERYCGLKYNGFAWDYSGATNTEELHTKLNNRIMIRRKKSEVLKDLPPKIRSIVPLEIDMDEYNKYEVDAENKGIEAMVQIEQLKQIAAESKMDQAKKWISDFLESGEKLVVFAWHTKILDLIEEEFKNISVRVDGSTPQKTRQEIVEAFQNDPKIKLFIGNIKAAGIGITLTAASNTCFLELGWTPGEHVQAEDRVHRIGQKDNVTAWYLVAKGTIEQKIMDMLEKKSQTLDQVLDGKSVGEESIFNELLKTLKK